jgi:hypothetical protein
MSNTLAARLLGAIHAVETFRTPINVKIGAATCQNTLKGVGCYVC